MEKLNRAQKCSILRPQNLGSREGPGPRAPGPPPASAPAKTPKGWTHRAVASAAVAAAPGQVYGDASKSLPMHSNVSSLPLLLTLAIPLGVFIRLDRYVLMKVL